MSNSEIIKNVKIKKKPLVKTFEQLYIISLTILVTTTSGYALSTVYSNIFYIILSLCIFLMIFNYLLKNTEFKLNSLNLTHLAYIFMIFLAISSFLVNLDSIYLNYLLKFLITITFSFLFTRLVNFNSFIFYYIKVLKIIVIVSLIAYVLFVQLQLPLSLPIVENINGMKYYNGIVFFLLDGVIMDRNTGIFWEPGIFSTFIIFALIFEIGFKDKSSLINILIFIIGILTTQSTSGYFMLVFILMLALSKKINGILSFLTILISVIFFIISYLNLEKIIFYLYNINPRVFGKFINNTDSVTDRIISPMKNLEILIDYPIMGAGIGKSDVLFSLNSIVTQTSTSTYFLAAFGVMGSLYTLFWIFSILNIKTINILSRIIILLVILIQINKEPHIFFSVTYIIMFYFIDFSQAKYPNEIRSQSKRLNLCSFEGMSNKIERN